MLFRSTLAISRLEGHAELAMVVERLRRAPVTDGGEFCREMRVLDQRRQQRFDLTHKEIAQAMGYVLYLQDESI